MIPTLPLEIIDRIVDFTVIPDRLQLALVSRQWLHRCRMQSFANFTIRGSHHRNGLPYDIILSDNGTIAPHIKTLVVSAMDIHPTQTWPALTRSAQIGRFCSLQYLSLWNIHWRNASMLTLSLCPQLKGLDLGPMEFESALDLAEMISTASLLETLKLNRIQFARPLETIIDTHFTISKSLTSLQLLVPQASIDEIVIWLESQAPQLHIDTLRFQVIETRQRTLDLSRHLGLLPLLGRKLRHLIVDVSSVLLKDVDLSNNSCIRSVHFTDLIMSSQTRDSQELIFVLARLTSPDCAKISIDISEPWRGKETFWNKDQMDFYNQLTGVLDNMPSRPILHFSNVLWSSESLFRGWFAGLDKQGRLVMSLRPSIIQMADRARLLTQT